jgi:hypothetical protein
MGFYQKYCYWLLISPFNNTSAALCLCMAVYQVGATLLNMHTMH